MSLYYTIFPLECKPRDKKTGPAGNEAPAGLLYFFLPGRMRASREGLRTGFCSGFSA